MNPQPHAINRLKREYEALMKVSSNYWSVRPTESNILIWQGNIHALEDPRHAKKDYDLEIRFSENHPFKPPVVRFKNRVVCENVFSNGTICLDILGDNWSPAIMVDQLMHSICSVLTDSPVTGLPYKGARPGIARRRTELELLRT